MQGWTDTMRYGITRKRSTKWLKHRGNLLRKNLQIQGLKQFFLQAPDKMSGMAKIMSDKMSNVTKIL